MIPGEEAPGPPTTDLALPLALCACCAKLRGAGAVSGFSEDNAHVSVRRAICVSHRHLYELLNSKITKDLLTQTQDHTTSRDSKLKITQHLLFN